MSQGPKLRVGMVAPPLPTPRHEGLELAIDALARGLHFRGHDVVLFTIVDPMRSRQWASQVGFAAQQLHEVTGLEGELGGCDIVHDHTLAALFVTNLHHRAPLVTTNYGPFDADPIPLYRRPPDDHVPMIAVSRDQADRAPDAVQVSTAIHPGIDVEQYRYRPRGSDHLLTTGRMEPSGGILEAIEVSKATSIPLVICASIEEPHESDFYYSHVRPHLGSTIQFADGLSMLDRIDLMGGAVALVHPATWPEPFAMVIIEAMACGTPTVARSGAAGEIISDGHTGFVVDTFGEMVAAVERIDSVSRASCRRRAEELFSCEEVAVHHEEFYREVIAASAGDAPALETADAHPVQHNAHF